MKDLKELALAAKDKQLGTLTIPIDVVLGLLSEIETLKAEVARHDNSYAVMQKLHDEDRDELDGLSQQYAKLAQYCEMLENTIDKLYSCEEQEELVMLRAKLAAYESRKPVAYLMQPTELSHQSLEKSLHFNKAHARSDWEVLPLFTAPEVK